MAEPLDHHMELLRQTREEMRRRFDKLDRSVAELTAESRITNAHMVGLVRFEDYATGKMAELETRLERLEKRLDLDDPALPPATP
jgi:ubiquinone biosynthesis protein UbiJ